MTADLPHVTDELKILGTTDEDGAARSRVEIHAARLHHGIEIDVSNSEIRGMVIDGCLLNGVTMGGSNNTVVNNVITNCGEGGVFIFDGPGGNHVEGNYLGTTPAG